MTDATSGTQVRLYVDVVSPYAYLAVAGLGDVERRHGLRIEVVPVLFAGLLKHHGQLGPAEIPTKHTLALRECMRRARRRDLPFVVPPAHPFVSLAALRCAWALPDGDRAACVRALFHAVWGEGRDLSDASVLPAILSAAGFDADELLAQAATDSIKGKLRAATDDAAARGVFGVPTYAIERPGTPTELIWSSESEQDLDEALRGGDRVTPSDNAAIEASISAGRQFQRRR